MKRNFILERTLLSIRPAFVAQFIKSILQLKRKIQKTSNGIFYIDPASNFGINLLMYGNYEEDMKNTIKKFLKKGDFFIDLGANEGYFSVIASKYVGKSGKVISIEPQLRLQNIICMNIKLNNISNIDLHQIAISNKNGITEISLSPDTNTGSSGLYRTTRYKNPTQLVQQKTLDSFLKMIRIKKIKLIKIDIESYEYEAILGSKDLFRSGIIENIALEYHSSILSKRKLSEKTIDKFLRKSGYYINKAFKNTVYSFPKTI